MPVANSFLTCVVDQLTARGFGQKRIKGFTDRLNGLAKAHEQSGMPPWMAQTQAAAQMYKEINIAAVERAKRSLATLDVHLRNKARIQLGHTVDTSAWVFDGKKGSKGVAIARAAISLEESDKRFPGLSYSSYRKTNLGMFMAIFDDALARMGKGAFGRQKGKAHLNNIPHEIWGRKTGDKNASDMAKAYTQIENLMVDALNDAGGSLTKRADFHLPQRHSSARMIKEKYAAFEAREFDLWNWDAMRWPDGSPIEPGLRKEYMRHVYETKTTNGANKIKAEAMGGRGRSLGNRLDVHRSVIYKDSDAWLKSHKAIGDGNVFEVMVAHINDMSHRIAMVQAFGPNPELTRQNIHNMVRLEASKVGGRAVSDAESVLKNKFDPMFEVMTRENPLDPDSNWGALVSGTANIITSAVLGSTPLISVPSDIITTALVRMNQGMRPFKGIGTAVKAILTDKQNQEIISNQSGFIMDDIFSSNYAVTRYTGLTSFGPAITRRIADVNMRLSLLSGSTRAIRWGNQAEFMGLMARDLNKGFDELPYKLVMNRYGIGAKEWDAFRKHVKPWNASKKNQTNFLRPIDILQSNIPNKSEMYHRFQGMIYEESYTMVPGASIEGQVFLRGSSRPDTLAGAILYSFAMFKNFPVSINMLYGRLAMVNPSRKGRAAFIGSMIAGLTFAGALSIQLREISKGRDPLDMATPMFLSKSMLAGGGMSIFGDFLFTGINEFGRGPEEATAGPIVGFIGDTAQLAFGDAFKWADALGGLAEPGEGSTITRGIEWARRYTPGSSLWYARQALNHYVFDALLELADPQGYRDRNRRLERGRQRDFGQSYWWRPGDSTPHRPPSFEGVAR